MSTLSNHILNQIESHTADPIHLAQLVRLHLEALLQSRGALSSGFDDASGFISEVRRLMSLRGKEDVATVRVEHALLRAEVQLAAHASVGKDGDDVVDRYRTFTEDNAGELFDSFFGWVEARIEDDLYIAQHNHFNTLRFDAVRQWLEQDLSMHRAALKVIKDHDLDDRFTRDSLYARLTGTLGQALGFLADLEDNPRRAQRLRGQAADLLLRDLSCLHRGTAHWLQGVNFLTSLYWRGQDLAAATRWFSEGLGRGRPLEVSDVVRITGPDSLVPQTHPQYFWLLVNQLRICCLGLRLHEVSVPAEQVGAALAMTINWDHADYPRNLALKWALVLADLAGGSIQQELLSKAHALLAPTRAEPILELMRAVELSLLAAVTLESGDARLWTDEAQGIIVGLSPLRGFDRFVNQSPWAHALTSGRRLETHTYDVATALPYYYA